MIPLALFRIYPLQRLSSVVFIALCLTIPELAMSQPIRVTGGNKTLFITTGSPGGEPISVTSSTNTLRYRRQVLPSKITVSTSCPGQSFNLQVVAVSVTDGVAAPAVSLTDGMASMDFITGIPATPPITFRTCTLQYTASATFSQGNSLEQGNDVHTVTYTILAQ